MDLQVYAERYHIRGFKKDREYDGSINKCNNGYHETGGVKKVLVVIKCNN